MNVEATPSNEEYIAVINEKEPPADKIMSSQTYSKNSTNAKDIKAESEVQDDMIPEELLFALSTVPTIDYKEKQRRLKLKDLKPDKNVLKKGSPSNVWHHKGRRMQFKHLIDQPRSLGKGVGTRDVSFLYDMPSIHNDLSFRLSKLDRNEKILEPPIGDHLKAGKLNVPDTILPEEYHFVKTKGVKGLEFYDEGLTTLIADGDQALRLFPSLQPTKRFEVIQLLKTLDAMLEQSGFNDKDTEVNGPTQIHNLLEVVKKEQTVYDLVFSEVIRQVSVQCLERGQLLGKLRSKYAELFNRIPRQIKSLHAEVMAQRALDRRLTEELIRFKSSITFLTSELQTVREHDQQVTYGAALAESELAKALKESQVNANLVDEYHDLYELQRRRLESSVTSLMSERDLWSNAAYSLALKITSINSLNTAKRLHISEKAWSKLSNHFVVKLSDHDSENLSQIQQHVEKWRDTMFHFDQDLERTDRRTRIVLNETKNGVKDWISKFNDKVVSHVADVRRMKLPTDEFIQEFCDFVKKFEKKLSEDCERFVGGRLLACEEQLELMKEVNESWTELAWNIYRRHRSEKDEDFPLCSTLKKLNKDLHILLKQLKIRITGENGVAKGIINIQTIFENWENKLTKLVHIGENMSERNWWLVYDQLSDFISTIEQTNGFVGTQENFEDRILQLPHQKLKTDTMMKQVQDWMKRTVSDVEAENGKLIAQASCIHSDLILWGVQMLLNLVPNRDTEKNLSPEPSMDISCSKEELMRKAKTISDHMSRFTDYFSTCCMDIVQEAMQEKKYRGEEDPDHEYRDLLRVKREAHEWIRTCEFLLNAIMPKNADLISSDIAERLRLPQEQATKTTTVTQSNVIPPSLQQPSGKVNNAINAIKIIKERSVEVKKRDITLPQSNKSSDLDIIPEVTRVQEGAKEAEEVLPAQEKDVQAQAAAIEEAETMIAAKKAADLLAKLDSENKIEVLGGDENVQSFSIEETEMRSTGNTAFPDAAVVLLQNAYDAIAKIDVIQKQLIETEIRAQEAEQRIIDLEQELHTAQSKVRTQDRTPCESQGQSSSQPAIKEGVNEASLLETESEPIMEKISSSTDNAKSGRRTNSLDPSQKRSSFSHIQSKPKRQSLIKKK